MSTSSPKINSAFVTQASQTSAEIADAIAKRKASQGVEEKKASPEKLGDVSIVEHLETDQKVLTKFGVELNKGLSPEQASARLEEFGPNKLTPASTKHPLVLLMEQMTGFFSLLLWLAGALCFLAYGLDSTIPDNLYLGIVLAVVTFLTGIFSFYQEYNANAIMEGFKDFLPKKCWVIRNDGEAIELDAELLVPGDVVDIKAGDAIPADLRVMTSSDFKVDNASLTGESDAQTRTNKNIEENCMEATNLAFFGTNCAKGKCRGIVIKTADDTLIGTIARLTTDTDNKKTPIAIEIEHFIHIVSGVAVFLGVTFFIIGITLYDWLTNLVFMIGIIVANVPEGLLATVTVSLTLTAKRMAVKNVLVKNLEAVETLGSTTVIASDKTGTLTQNRMTAVELFIYMKGENGLQLDSTFPLNTGEERNTVNRAGGFDKALMSMALCNNAKFEASEDNMKLGIQQRETQGDASESALLKFCEHIVQTQPDCKNVNEFRTKHPKIGEIPFNSTNKYQVSVHLPNGDENVDRLLTMKGAPERIWQKCCKVNICGEELDKTEEHKKIFDHNIDNMMFKGERVLGLSYAILDSDEYECPAKEAGSYVESPSYDPSQDHIFGREPYDPHAEPHREPATSDIQLVFCGLIALIDPPRPTVPKAVLSCQKAGIKVVMVTGDHPETAESIARKVYIIRDMTQRDVCRKFNLKTIEDSDPRVQAIVIPGKKLATLTDEELDNFLDYDQIVFARTSPAQKLKIVEGLQRKTHIRRNLAKPKPVKHVVAVTGDGVNDSPALKAANIGVAMGITGTEVAKDAADMILLDDNFASIVNGVEEGRLIFDNLKKSIAYTLSSNIPEISPFLVFILIQCPLPLPTILILCIDLGTDMVPAISLAYEGREANIMSKPPRDARVDRLVTAKLVCFSYLQVGIVQAAAGFYAWVVVLKDFGFDPASLPGIHWAFDRESWNCLVPANSIDRQSSFPAVVQCGSWDSSIDENCLKNTAGSWRPNYTTAIGEIKNPFWGLNVYGFSSRKTNCWTNNGFGKNKKGFDLWARHFKYSKHLDWKFVATTTECYVNPGGASEGNCWNAAEALMYAQTAYFISIIIVQWSDILACKTRTLSLKNQGMRNNMLTFGLFFETTLGAILCYVPFVQTALATRPIYFVHWLAPMPFAIFILSYDEIRKWLMRNLSADFEWFNTATWMKKPDEGDQPKNWVWRNTYY